MVSALLRSASAATFVTHPFAAMAAAKRVQPVLDEDWAEMMASFQAAKKPSKWKFKMLMETGEHSVVRHEDGHFVKSYRGETVLLLSMSDVKELERLKRFSEYVGPRPSATDGTDGEFVQRFEERATGNHQPRNHPVRVPTAPGQPVRG